MVGASIAGETSSRELPLMNGQHAGLSRSRTARNAAIEPPGYDRVAGALRQSSRLLLTLGTFSAASGAGLVAAALLAPAGGLATPVFLGAGGFLVALALLPLGLGWRRVRRAAFLAAIRARWTRLERIGDPDDQVPTLARAYAGLVGNDLRTRVAGGPWAGGR